MKLLFLSDVRNFQFSEMIINHLKPSYVLFLGDILFDGPGQFYIVDKLKIQNFFERDKLLKENQVYSIKRHLIIKGNTHISKEMFRIHLYYFLKTLKLLERLNIGYALISGNHDMFIDYNDLFLHNGLNKGIFIENYRKILIDNTVVILSSYGSSLDPLSVKDAKIVATHESQRKLKDIIKNLRACSGLISGHYGIKIELYSGDKQVRSAPYEKLLIKIDDFPLSFAVYEKESFILYKTDIESLINFKLKSWNFNTIYKRICMVNS
ncbi:MAG: hypothetical protein ACP5LF_01280 [Nitrososphaeria archaeon]|nr:hypothetical protein [Conexivisphaerales archaeon]